MRNWTKPALIVAAVLLTAVACLAALTDPSRVLPPAIDCENNYLSIQYAEAAGRDSEAEEIANSANRLFSQSLEAFSTARDAAGAEEAYAEETTQRVAAFHNAMQRISDTYNSILQRWRGVEQLPANPFEVPAPDPIEIKEVKEIAARYLKRENQIQRTIRKVEDDIAEQRLVTTGRLASVANRRLVLAKALVGQGDGTAAIGEECGSKSLVFRLSRARSH
jgi:hypothetical protein